jgi:predicted dehydrogenase
MKKLKIGILGCGYMAQMAHLPAFKSLPDAEIAVLCDPRKKVAEALAKKWDVPKVTDSAEKLVKCDIDAVCVLTRVEMHKQHIIMALEAGKSVFTEKPIAMSEASAREIKKAAQKAKKLVAVGYMKRHEMNITAALKTLKEKNPGKLIFARSHSFIGRHWNACVDTLNPPVSSDETVKPDFKEYDSGPSWLKSPRDNVFYSFDNPYYGLLDTGCHSVNLARFLTGAEPEISSVVKSGGMRLIQMKLGDSHGTIEFCVNFNMDCWDEQTELYYEKSTVRIKTPQPTFIQSCAEASVYSENGALHENLVFGENHQWAFRAQAADFVSRALKGGHGLEDIESAARDIGVIEKIYRLENHL